MGSSHSTDNSRLVDGQDRNLYITCDGFKEFSGNFGPFKVFELTISHQRYTWKIYKRYNEITHLHKKVKGVLERQGHNIHPPKSKIKLVWNRHNMKILHQRGVETAKYLENLGTIDSLWKSKELMEFLEISQLSFIPELGRKGKCGYLKKVRGGVFSSWRWRLVVAHDAYIASYIPGRDGVSPTDFPEEVLRIDSGLVVTVSGRYVDIKSNSGKLSLCAYTRRQALEWKTFMNDFYDVKVSARVQKSPSGLTSFPPRCSLEEIEAFHCSRDYFHSLAVQLINATSDIFITSAELSPTVLLTRSPLPPLRLDQILRFKANQGIHIFIMINREGNPAVASHNSSTNSYQVKAYLQGLSPNIKVIRITKSPLVGFQNEKLVVIDRVTAFTGSFDINFGQFDDFSKAVEDEAGVKFPGHDYVQPSSGSMRPAKTIARPQYKKASSPSNAAMTSASADVSRASSVQNEQEQYENGLTGAGHSGQPSSGNVTYTVPPRITIPDSEEATGVGAGSGTDSQQDLHNVDAPSRPLSMYQSTPFPYLHPPAGGDSGGTESPVRGSSTPEGSHSHALEGGIDSRMVDMFSDEDHDAVEEERRRLSVTGANLGGTQPGSRKKKGSLTNSLYSALSTIVTSFFQEDAFIDAREEYPRQPWHGVQMRIQGLTARDLSSHFVQKWRQHRSTSAQMSACVSEDITDDNYNSICARCKCANIFEDAGVCPNCNLPLGRISKYSQAFRASMGPRCMPVPPSDYSYIVFECHFESKIGCLLHGQGPVAVEQLVNSRIDMSPGQLLHEQGAYADALKYRGLFPSVADIFVSVDYTDVTHLDFMELKRFFQRRLAIRRVEGLPLSVTFRRHHIQSAVNTYRDFLERLSVVHTSAVNYMDIAETAQVVSYEPAYVDTPGILPPSKLPSPTFLDEKQDRSVASPPIYSQGVASALPPLSARVDPVTGMYTHGAHIGQAATATVQPQEVEVVAVPSHSHGAGAYMEHHEEVSRETMFDSTPYGGFYPSLDAPSAMHSNDSQESVLHHEQSQQGGWEIPDQMWATGSANHSQEREASGRDLAEGELQQEELSLEDYLSRHNITGHDIAVPSEAKEDSQSNSHLVESKGDFSRGEEVVRKDAEEKNEVNEETEPSPSITFPAAPNSLPSVMFPDAPTHSLSEVTSLAVSRGLVVSENESHESQHGVRRKKEMSASGRPGHDLGGVGSGRQVHGNGQDFDPFSSNMNSHIRQTSPPPTLLSQGIDHSQTQFMRDSPSQETEGGQFEKECPLPAATVISDDKEDAGAESPGTIRGFPFPPLFIPDDVFLPAHRIHACEEAIQMDNSLSMSVVGHSVHRGRQDSRDVFPFDVHHPEATFSTGPLCQVQVLRSVNEWSSGSRKEKSILEGWIKAIEDSKHLVYIENSLFASMPISSSKQKGESMNGVAEALVARLVLAANGREQFRVIIVLPQHGSGDYCDSNRCPVVERNMALQHKVLHAIIDSFQEQCPNVVWSQYIGLFSLMNWGIMNEKVVHSQVYVSSSVLIVDDRVAIVGSAGVSDQEMNGGHNSNISVLVEDATPVSIQLGGRVYDASRFAHTLRMNLMRHHIGDNDPFSRDMVDMAIHADTVVGGAVGGAREVSRRNPYDGIWRDTATRNVGLYKRLDGEFSVYDMCTLDEFKKKHVRENFVHKSEHDPQVQSILGDIRGYLVPFPLDFNVS